MSTPLSVNNLFEHLQHRYPHVVDHHSPIDGEEGSLRTTSESTAPRTPSSYTAEAHPFHIIIRHNEYTDDQYATDESIMSPEPAKGELHRPPRPAPFQNHSAPQATTLKDIDKKQTLSSQRPGFGNRIGSYVRNKLQRSQPDEDEPLATHCSDDYLDKAISKPETKARPTTKKRIEERIKSDPASIKIVSPTKKRLSASSIVCLASKTANAKALSTSIKNNATPPSNTSSERPQARKESASASNVRAKDQSKSGITWATGGAEKAAKRQGWGRRRSVSTEQTPRLPHVQNGPTAGMLPTFSQGAEEGVGLKARRLSISLPSDFIIEWCDLYEEFQQPSLMSGIQGKLLGKGATSEVRVMARKGDALQGEVLVAVKEFRERNKEETEEDYVLKIKSEYSIAKSLRHPNIVRTVRLCTNKTRWNHVMEFCTYGELYSLVERRLFTAGPQGYFTDAERVCLFKQLVRGVDYLHTHGIAHRDIKLENLLLDVNGHLKISDFGVAEVFSGEHPGLRASGGECGKNMRGIRLSALGICGSLPYIAPEVLCKKGSYDPRAVDVWSCAIVYLTMTFGGCPWQAAKGEFEYFRRFRKGWVEWLEEHPDGKIEDGLGELPNCGKLFNLIEPEEMKKLMLQMLHPIPSKRITIREVLETNFVREIECCCPEMLEEEKRCCDGPVGTGEATRRTSLGHRHIPLKVIS